MRVVASLHDSLTTEVSSQMLGPLVVTLVGALMLAGILRRLLFRSVTEGLACLDRRFVTDPQPSDAFQPGLAAKLLTIFHR